MDRPLATSNNLFHLTDFYYIWVRDRAILSLKMMFRLFFMGHQLLAMDDFTWQTSILEVQQSVNKEQLWIVLKKKQNKYNKVEVIKWDLKTSQRSFQRKSLNWDSNSEKESLAGISWSRAPPHTAPTEHVSSSHGQWTAWHIQGWGRWSEWLSWVKEGEDQVKPEGWQG